MSNTVTFPCSLWPNDSCPFSISAPACAATTNMENNKNQQERVIIWNKKYRRKVGGNAAPLRRNLATYLQKHPDCEVYSGQDLYKESVPAIKPILPRGQPLPYSNTNRVGPIDWTWSRRESSWYSENPKYKDNYLRNGVIPPESSFSNFWEQRCTREVNYVEESWMEQDSCNTKPAEHWENQSGENNGAWKNDRTLLDIEQIVESSDSSIRHISEVSAEENALKPALKGLCELSSQSDGQFQLSMVSPCISSPEGSFPFSNSLHTPYSIDSSGSSYSLKERWAILRSEATKNLDKNSEVTQEEEGIGSFPGSVSTPSRIMDYEYYSSYHEFR